MYEINVASKYLGRGEFKFKLDYMKKNKNGKI
jgi:hypothetical protein